MDSNDILKDKTTDLAQQHAPNPAPREDGDGQLAQEFLDRLSTEEKDELYRSMVSDDSEEDTSSPQYKSPLGGVSKELNNRFDTIDNKKKATLVLILAFIILVMGLFYLYHFIRIIFG